MCIDLHTPILMHIGRLYINAQADPPKQACTCMYILKGKHTCTTICRKTRGYMYTHIHTHTCSRVLHALTCMLYMHLHIYCSLIHAAMPSPILVFFPTSSLPGNLRDQLWDTLIFMEKVKSSVPAERIPMDSFICSVGISFFFMFSYTYLLLNNHYN